MSLNDRVGRLEHRAAGDRGVLLIKVVGGPTPEGAELRYGGVHGVGDYERGPGETLEAFELRLLVWERQCPVRNSGQKPC